jgi:hypothetical protein
MSSKGWISAAIAGAMAASACGGGGATGTGGGGGTTSASTGSTGGGSTASSTGSTGSTGTGGATGTGGGGGGGTTCLDGTSFASLFTIADPAFCAVAVYTADESIGYQAPTWGTHGGPLWFVADASGGVTLERWTPPAGATGKLTKQTTHVDTMIPTGAFAGAQAVDLPFFGWTALAWTGAAPSTQGDVIMIKGGAVDRTFAVNGTYGLAGVGTATSGRLLTTALSPVGAAATDLNGFYGADACSSPTPDLGAGTGCGAPAEIAAWGDASGPVAVDHAGNAFVVLASFGMGTQEARGFASAGVAKGGAPEAGATLFTLPGFGSALAALAPSGSQPGLLVFQPFDGTTFAPLDVVAQAYTAGAAVAAQGAPTKLLTVPTDATAGLSFLGDAQDRLWVASVTSDTSTTFVVLERKH